MIGIFKFLRKQSPIVAPVEIPKDRGSVKYRPVQTVQTLAELEQAKAAAVQHRISATDDQHAAMAARFDEQIKRTLPCEEQLRSRLAEERNECLRAKHDRRWPRIDLSFLQWRRRDSGWPVFAVFAPEDARCAMSAEFVRVRSRDDTVLRNSIDWRIAVHYRDILSILHNKCLDAYAQNTDIKEMRASISASFNGSIPQNVRDAISGARKEFESVHIIAEVPEWRLDEDASTKGGDPLVIGAALGAFWLVAAFDTTPAEDVVRAEWASGPIKSR